MLAHGLPITITITTCKRLHYFEQTIAAFQQNCKDFDNHIKVILADDGSSDADRNHMQKNWPQFEYVYHNHGQPHSLSVLFSMVKTPYFFHLEDDWILTKKFELLGTSLAILQKAGLHSLILGKQIGAQCKIEQHQHIPYYIHKHVDDGRFSSNYATGNSSWPGFYLAPGLHTTSAVQSIEYKSIRQHERNFAKAYHAAGYKVAFTTKMIFRHIGQTSAYKITQNAR